MINWQTADLVLLARQLAVAGPKLRTDAVTETTKAGKNVELAWRNAATASSGRHGKHYPKSIKARKMGAGLTAIVEPDASMPQGGMSFEFGSRNQPPHLDGQSALDGEEGPYTQAIEKAAEAALRFL